MIIAAAIQALFRNKMRSGLTMLGVFIGVAALIAMVAVGQGANNAVRKQIESLGTNLVVVVPGARTIGGAQGGLGSASTLTVSDAQAKCAGCLAFSLLGFRRARQMLPPLGVDTNAQRATRLSPTLKSN